MQDDNPQQVSDDRQELTLSARRVDESMEEVLPLPEVEETTPSLEVTVTDTADDDSHRLPPEISLEGLTVGRSDDSQRVVVPSDVVDAMITEQELGGSGEKAVAEAPKNVASTPVTSEPTAAVPEVQAEASRKKANLGAALKAIDKRHYALQLAALKSLSAANNFIAEYQIDQIATIYETRRNGEPWFIVISGDYPNIVAARRAETQLPERLQIVQPWVKSYAQIHREIERVK